MKIIFLSILILNSYLTPTYAYLDPGSASIILQFIFFVISSILIFFKSLKKKIGNLFKKKTKKSTF